MYTKYISEPRNWYEQIHIKLQTDKYNSQKDGWQEELTSLPSPPQHPAPPPPPPKKKKKKKKKKKNDKSFTET